MEKTGRNDHCPCGSGKKYKKCCMLKKDSVANYDLVYRRLRETEGQVMAKIELAMEEQFASHSIGGAWQDFYLWEEDLHAGEKPLELDFLFPVFHSFHWQPEPLDEDEAENWPDTTPALWLMQQEKLSTAEVTFIEAAVSSPFSFYKVLALEAGRSILLEEMFTGTQVEVIEKQASQQDLVDRILFTSVVSLNGISMMLGCAPYPFPAQYGIEILKYRDSIAELGKPWSVDKLADIAIDMREHYFNFKYRLLTPPTMVNNEGQLLELHQLTYRLDCLVDEAVDKLLTLNKCDESEAISLANFDNDNRITNTCIYWVERIKGKYIKCASLFLEQQKLVVETNSCERSEQIQRKITRRLGKNATLLSDDIFPLDFSGAKATINKAQASQALPPELAQVQQEYMQQYYRDWLDKPVPALENKTPRQASKSKQGKQMLALLLDSFETSPDCPVDWLRQQLGVE